VIYQVFDIYKVIEPAAAGRAILRVFCSIIAVSMLQQKAVEQGRLKRVGRMWPG
jgi:hypothetical protein